MAGGGLFSDDNAITGYRLPMSKGIFVFFVIVLCFVSALAGWMAHAWIYGDETLVVDCSSSSPSSASSPPDSPSSDVSSDITSDSVLEVITTLFY